MTVWIFTSCCCFLLHENKTNEHYDDVNIFFKRSRFKPFKKILKFGINKRKLWLTMTIWPEKSNFLTRWFLPSAAANDDDDKHTFTQTVNASLEEIYLLIFTKIIVDYHNNNNNETSKREKAENK